MTPEAQSLYLAAARLAAAIRHAFPDPLEPRVWFVALRDGLASDDLDEDGSKWVGFAQPEPDLSRTHRALLAATPGLWEMRQTLREAAILARDLRAVGPARDVYMDLMRDLLDSRWLADSPGWSDGEVACRVIAPNAYLADQMAIAARDLPLAAAPIESSPQPTGLLAEIGDSEFDPLCLYEAILKENKERGIKGAAKAAAEAVAAITNKRCTAAQMRVYRKRKRDKEAKAKPDRR